MKTSHFQVLLAISIDQVGKKRVPKLFYIIRFLLLRTSGRDLKEIEDNKFCYLNEYVSCRKSTTCVTLDCPYREPHRDKSKSFRLLIRTHYNKPIALSQPQKVQ